MRKGSALLIVLGLLSFMVVSAVSFSIYMRQSRLPSSYLRRNVAARHLVKAALARAIDELDGAYNDDRNWGKYEMTETDVRLGLYGIYDDPYPGCGYKAGNNANEDGDFWFRRVFMPFGPTKYAEATVPTLTLEALAYLPPALVDDVRKFSRYTRTAAWRALPYEAGRYAYCAVNVSDLFDVNRLRADAPRDSGPNRITLAPLCSQTAGDPFDINAGTATTLDALQQKWSSSGYDTPFVSLADFNLLAGASGFTPFMNYVGKTSTKLLKNGDAEAANAMFVTDTWFPPATSAASSSSGSSSGSSVETVTYDLAGAHQPFVNFDAKDWPSILDSLNKQDNVRDVFEKNLGLGLVALYDYLDSDSQPTSLALPTVEAVPMVTGVSCPAMLTPEIEAHDKGELIVEVENPNYDPNDASQPKTWKIKRSWSKLTFTGFGNRVLASALMTYPFKRMKTTGRFNSNFKLRGVLRVFAAPADMGCRPSDGSGNLYPSRQDQNAWQSGSRVRNGVASFFCETANPSPDSLFGKDVEKTDDAIGATTLTFDCSGIDMPIMYTVSEECTNGKGPDGFESKTYLTLDGLKSNATTFRPLTKDGEIDGAWNNLSARDKADFMTDTKNLGTGALTDSLSGFSGSYRLYAAVWLQVQDALGNVVDMAPASYKDDVEFLGSPSNVGSAGENKCGGGTPLLSFCAAYDVTFTEKIQENLNEKVATYPDWSSLYAVDPRYNFAPEDWFAKSSTSVSKNEWTGEVYPLLGQDGRDRDVFMFVSDQEYLQAIGELQFLPVMGRLDGSENFLSGDYSPEFGGGRFSQRTSAAGGGFANGGRFWRTYTAYDNGNGTDSIYALPYSGKEYCFQSGVGDFKVNPYSDDDRVLSAALVGTPFDYFVASTNSNQRQVGGTRNNFIDTIRLDNSLKQYSFGEATLAKMSADDLLAVMDEFRSVFGERAKSQDATVVADWAGGFDKLEWQKVETSQVNDDNKAFMGIASLAEASACPLHQVDRKFLYSFWRECFENRQQLFLVFVRAEPMSASGGSVGKAMPSSQLGGRAVALVWRDPATPSYQSSQRKTRQDLSGTGDSVREDVMEVRETCPPHRTRVLFYHQFE